MTRPQPQPDPLLSPHEIAQGLHDIGRISQGDAHRLQQRITAWAASQKAEGRREGIAEAVRRAKIAVAGIKSAAQRAAAQKPLRAVQSLLLPKGSEDYQRGYQDGTTDERRKARTNQPS
jgi:flagellar biosynthesis/type III secretory pathway protein FliH